MLVGWINVYEVRQISDILFWSLIGLGALVLLGYQITAYLNQKKSVPEPADNQSLPIRVLPESKRWEDYTRDQGVIRDISEVALSVATGPIVQWESIYPLVKTQAARDVIRQCIKVYLYRSEDQEATSLGKFV